MTKMFCDACGEQGYALHVEMRTGFAGGKTSLDFCQKCAFVALEKLGFCMDAGAILSLARGEEATGESDIPKIARDVDVPIAAAMLNGEETDG